MKLLATSSSHLKQVQLSSFNLLRTTTRTVTTKENTNKAPKAFTQEDFDKVNSAKMEASKLQYIKDNPDPFSPFKQGIKAIAGAFLFASLCAVGYGAYDPGYRRTLRTTYPLAAAVLNMVMEKEVESVVDQQISNEKASIFREEFKDGYKP